ncbi:hypothetical protein BDP27DRAFT_1405754 [Rhodocollybia butyracea]|uniref:Uncharacterized protein n=1 Tax=Rhodocollybia butyracea TaxID=206335 RepID=A0A9P5PKA0_9AGAR|nr:hypothetical protein BDP27DRAFT_1405754 [Rhodocollybia butyracea]
MSSPAQEFANRHNERVAWPVDSAPRSTAVSPLQPPPFGLHTTHSPSVNEKHPYTGLYRIYSSLLATAFSFRLLQKLEGRIEDGRVRIACARGLDLLEVPMIFSMPIESRSAALSTASNTRWPRDAIISVIARFMGYQRQRALSAVAALFTLNGEILSISIAFSAVHLAVYGMLRTPFMVATGEGNLSSNSPRMSSRYGVPSTAIHANFLIPETMGLSLESEDVGNYPSGTEKTFCKRCGCSTALREDVDNPSHHDDKLNNVILLHPSSE